MELRKLALTGLPPSSDCDQGAGCSPIDLAVLSGVVERVDLAEDIKVGMFVAVVVSRLRFITRATNLG